MRAGTLTRILAAALLACAPLPAPAEQPDAKLAGVLRDVGIDQKLNNQVPGDLAFRDENNQPVRLKDYYGKKPIILNLVYFECPMLCSQVTNGLVNSLKMISLNPGRDFTILTVSFDPRETASLAAPKRLNYLGSLGRPGAEEGWHFLTGGDKEIKALADAAGFRYVWDAKLQQYAHAAAIMVMTPEGRMSRYFYGIEYSPRDLRLGLVEAGKGKIGGIADSVLLLCYHYDPSTGKYSMTVLGIIRLAGVATVAGLAGFMGVMFWRDRRNRRLSARHAG